MPYPGVPDLTPYLDLARAAYLGGDADRAEAIARAVITLRPDVADGTVFSVSCWIAAANMYKPKPLARCVGNPRCAGVSHRS